MTYFCLSFDTKRLENFSTQSSTKGSIAASSWACKLHDAHVKGHSWHVEDMLMAFQGMEIFISGETGNSVCQKKSFDPLYLPFTSPTPRCFGLFILPMVDACNLGKHKRKQRVYPQTIPGKEKSSNSCQTKHNANSISIQLPA